MRPYARNGRKTRINNRKKFSSTRGKISWEFSPRNYPRRISPLSLLLIRMKKARRQGLNKKQLRKYIDAML